MLAIAALHEGLLRVDSCPSRQAVIGQKQSLAIDCFQLLVSDHECHFQSTLLSKVIHTLLPNL